MTDTTTNRLWALIRQLQGRVPVTGVASATWTASLRSATATVPHGLPVTPSSASAGSVDSDLSYAVTSADATNIYVVGFYLVNTTLTGTFQFTWAAYR